MASRLGLKLDSSVTVANLDLQGWLLKNIRTHCGNISIPSNENGCAKSLNFILNY